MTGYMLRALGISLGLTLVLELSFALLWRKGSRALLLVALVNLLTNPPVALTALLWRHRALPGYVPLAAALELGAIFVEGLIYRKSREFSRPYLFSLCANAFSFGVGFLLNHLL